MLRRTRRENKNIGSTNVYTADYWAGDCEETMGKETLHKWVLLNIKSLKC
jgi:hypothetical protein